MVVVNLTPKPKVIFPSFCVSVGLRFPPELSRLVVDNIVFFTGDESSNKTRSLAMSARNRQSECEHWHIHQLVGVMNLNVMKKSFLLMTSHPNNWSGLKVSIDRPICRSSELIRFRKLIKAIWVVAWPVKSTVMAMDKERSMNLGVKLTSSLGLKLMAKSPAKLEGFHFLRADWFFDCLKQLIWKRYFNDDDRVLGKGQSSPRRPNLASLDTFEPDHWRVFLLKDLKNMPVSNRFRDHFQIPSLPIEVYESAVWHKKNVQVEKERLIMGKHASG